VALGSINGTIKDVVDAERVAGASVGSVTIASFRPFPLAALGQVLAGAKRVICLEKSLAPGLGGMLASNVRMALQGTPTRVYTVIAGLGGRPITRTSLTGLFRDAALGTLEDVTFLDLNRGVINAQMAAAARHRQSGPIAENLLKAVNAGLLRPAAPDRVASESPSEGEVKP
jgi:pyruvate ferredoxin oxidoreductase alpha subunit